MERPRRRWLLTVFKIAIVLVVGVFLFGTIQNARQRLASKGFSWDQLRPGWIAAAIGLYLAGLLPMFVFWRRILAAMGQRTTLLNALYAFTVGHLGKYVPGKAMVVMLRVGLLSDRTAPTLALAASVVVETLTMMSVGSLLAALFLAAQAVEHPERLAAALGFVLIAALPTLPPIFRWLVTRTARSPAERSRLTESLTHVNYRLLAEGWALNLIGWCLLGTSLWAVMTSVSPQESSPPLGSFLPNWVGWVSISVVAGFLSFIPGGMIVRDGVLIELMTQMFDPVRAILAALLLRAAWLSAEMLFALVLHLMTRLIPWQRQPDPSAAEES